MVYLKFIELIRPLGSSSTRTFLGNNNPETFLILRDNEMSPLIRSLSKFVAIRRRSSLSYHVRNMMVGRYE